MNVELRNEVRRPKGGKPIQISLPTRLLLKKTFFSFFALTPSQMWFKRPVYRGFKCEGKCEGSEGKGTFSWRSLFPTPTLNTLSIAFADSPQNGLCLWRCSSVWSDNCISFAASMRGCRQSWDSPLRPVSPRLLHASSGSTRCLP